MSIDEVIRPIRVFTLISTWLLLVTPLSAQTWTQLEPTGVPPGPRGYHSAILDSVTNQMIIFGGNGGGGDLSDVRSLTTAGRQQWTTVTPAGNLPPGRSGHTAVYDSANSRMTIFGGRRASSPCVNDVWVLGNANSANGTPTWIQLSPAGGPPAPRFTATAVYDPTSNRMIVFGGNNCSPGGEFNDVWILSNANGLGGTPTWTQLSPAGTAPAVRASQAAVYDVSTNRMTIYGGSTVSTTYSDVWVLSNANGLGGPPAWTQLSPSGQAPPTPGGLGNPAVYDSSDNRMIVVSGSSPAIWVLSNANGLGGTPNWTQLSPSGPPIQSRYAHSVVYDNAANRTIVFGGSSGAGPFNDTWVVTNADDLPNAPGQTWNQLAPTGGPPAARVAHSAILDRATNQMLVFGGIGGVTDLQDLWSLTTSGAPQWTSVPTTGAAPPARLGHSAVYDSANFRMTIFGGGLGRSSPCANDVWALSNANRANGTPTWTQLSPTGAAPVPRIFHTAVYDPTSNRMIVFGGNNCFTAGAQFYNDVWILTNANGLGGTPAWIQLSPTGTLPGARENLSSVYDVSSNRMIVFGGNGSAIYYNDVWVLSNANGLGGTPTWTQLSPSGATMPPKTGHTAVYDYTSNRMVVFAGSSPAVSVPDTWVLTNANGLNGSPAWIQLAVGTPPNYRGEHTAVYDPGSNRMIVFGGGASIPLSDSWVLTDANGIPGQPGPAIVSASPGSGGGPSQAFQFQFTDPSGAADLTTLWMWFTTSFNSSTLANSCLLYYNNGTNQLNLLNDAGTAWIAMTPGTAGNLQNSQCSIAVANATISSSGNNLAISLPVTFRSAGAMQAWMFAMGTTASSGWQQMGSWNNGLAWTQLAPTGVLPAARGATSAIFDAGTNQMLVFGGNGVTDLQDLWSLTTAGAPHWTSVATAGATPPARLGHSAVYDSANFRMTIFGGGLGRSSPCANDAWVLSNANRANGTPTWAQLSPTGAAPVPRIFHTAVYDPTSNRMIVFGGNNCFTAGAQFYNDVWVLTNANGLGGTPAWIQLSASGTLPAGRENFSSVYDVGSNRMIIFGGSGNATTFSDVWVLSNANGLGGPPAWTQLSPGGAPIPARGEHTAVYDSASNRMIVFGGGTATSVNSDVWTLSFANGLGGTPFWTRLSPSTTIPGRSQHTAVYDARGNRMIIFGGFVTSVGAVNETWVLTNANGLAGAPALRFIPVTPCRVADTRNTTGTFGGPAISSGTSRDFNIPNSACLVPSTAQAYSLNVTVVPSAPLSYLTMWPAGQTRPVTSTLNSLDGRIKSNAAIVPAGTAGAVSIFASDTANVVLDINGYFVPAIDPTGLAFYPIAPCRIADTRTAGAPLGGPSLSGGTSRTFPISAVCSLPVTAQAYSLNLTAVPGGQRLGYVAAWPTGQAMPVASSLNALTGTVVANAAIVKAGASGSIDVFASDATNLVIDINGYFAPMGPGGLSLYNVAPCRVVDTRQPPGSAPITSLDVAVTASVCGIPANAQAHVLNVTVVPPGIPPSPLGFLTLWQQGQNRPAVSTLNALDGAITSNLAIVPAVNGSISVFASDPAQVIIDISGYFGQ